MTESRRTLPERPIGIAILAVLAAIGAMYDLLLLLALFGGVPLFGGFVIMIAVTLLAVAIVTLVFAYGAWTLKPWAWTLGVVLEAVLIVFALYSLTRADPSAVVTLGIAGVILWYLFQPSVKAAFERT